jgi:hypothetical protein
MFQFETSPTTPRLNSRPRTDRAGAVSSVAPSPVPQSPVPQSPVPQSPVPQSPVPQSPAAQSPAALSPHSSTWPCWATWPNWPEAPPLSAKVASPGNAGQRPHPPRRSLSWPERPSPLERRVEVAVPDHSPRPSRGALDNSRLPSTRLGPNRPAGQCRPTPQALSPAPANRHHPRRPVCSGDSQPTPSPTRGDVHAQRPAATVS